MPPIVARRRAPLGIPIPIRGSAPTLPGPPIRTPSRAPARNTTRHPPPAVTLILALAATALLALPAAADDIDVYTARIAAQKKPNILFVLDYSGSMNEDVDGNDARRSGRPRKIDVLKDAMDGVLEANVGKIRAGIGSIYDSTAGGVRWPVSELDADAHDIDPAIPEGALTAREVMLSQLDRQQAGGHTRTVNALVEAATYFRGGLVPNSGRDAGSATAYRSDTWDVAARRYAGGDGHAPIGASYRQPEVPDPAYWRELFERGELGTCRDYGVSGGENLCAGKTIVQAECTRKEGGRRQGAYLECRHLPEDSPIGARYRSPIEGQCESNAIVLISDGLPDRYRDTPALREVLGLDPASRSPLPCESLKASVFPRVADDTDGDCGPEVVRRLASVPQRPGIPDSTVRTYTVGFGLEGAGQDYLDLLGAAGRGGSFSADSRATLNEALRRIVDDAAGRAESFVELSLDVDRASFSHDGRAYFSLFTPGRGRGWSGNLKGYFLDGEGFRDADGAPALVTDERGTRFADAARSFWSRAPDGNVASAGGASGRLGDGPRTLYTFLGGPGDVPAAGVDLARSAAHRLASDNAAITPAHLGAATSAAVRTAALDWLHAAPMGDPLHSRSVSVDYGTRQVVYVATNQGLLHAIDATAPTAPGERGGGAELFAFMPRRLLPNLVPLSTDAGGVEDHVYGLDGPITRWHDDLDGDGVVDGEDTVLLIVGMRRGGEAYHALDVTDPTRPRLAWTLDASTPGFAELAQSWSRASLVRVGDGDGERRVLMFGGGYDPILDGGGPPRPSRGNAVFVVDRAGRLVAKFTHPDMRHAIAADPTVIDSDADGLADRLYAADLGGQVWRVDFDDPANAADTVVTRLASLAGGARQPFFAAPSVARNRGANGEYLSIALGSGDRTEPLDESSANAFFMIRDENVAKGPPARPLPPATPARLYDATANRLGSDDPAVAAAARAALEAARGWRVRLAPGEKSLSRLTSFDGELLATTFAPDATDTDPCRFPSVRRFYRMDIGTAVPVATDAATETTLVDGGGRARRLGGQGIPSSPLVVFPRGASEARILVDREPVGTVGQRLARVYWHAK